MYAIIKTGGKQYRVAEGDTLHIERLGDITQTEFHFNDVLLVMNGEKTLVGLPLVQGYTVIAEVVGEIRGPKIKCMKYKQRKRFRKHIGHRQDYHTVKIKEIRAN